MPTPRDVFYLSDEQFDKIVELLTPGYELSIMYLAQMKAQAPKAPEETKPEETT
jgi:hypothetical protein